MVWNHTSRPPSPYQSNQKFYDEEDLNFDRQSQSNINQPQPLAKKKRGRPPGPNYHLNKRSYTQNSPH